MKHFITHVKGAQLLGPSLSSSHRKKGDDAHPESWDLQYKLERIWEVKNSSIRSEGTGRCPSPLKSEDSRGEREQETQSPAPGQTVPAHSWLLDVFKCDEALQEGHNDTDPLLDLLLPLPTKNFDFGIPIFCIFLKAGETAWTGDAINSTTNSPQSPR